MFIIFVTKSRLYLFLCQLNPTTTTRQFKKKPFYCGQRTTTFKMYVYAFQILKHNGKHYLNISILPLLRIGLESDAFSISLPTKFVYTFLVSARSLTETERYEKKYHFGFKVCKSVHHRTIQIDHQPDATIFQFIILTFIYSSTCFERSLAHHQELNDCSSSLWFYRGCYCSR